MVATCLAGLDVQRATADITACIACHAPGCRWSRPHGRAFDLLMCELQSRLAGKKVVVDVDACSGPFRFDWLSGRWVYHRTHQDLLQQLQQELKQLTGADISLDHD